MQMLVVGGAGFIGSHLVDRLLAEGHSVDVVDDLSSGSLANLADARAAAGDGQFKFHHLDAASTNLGELVALRRPEVVFHLAANPNAHPVGALAATLSVLNAARDGEVRKVVSALSARSLYGDVSPRELPVKEDHPWAPTTVGGVTARALAELFSVYRAAHAVEFTVLALANVYGPRQRPDDGVVAAFAEAVRGGTPAVIEGDGRQTRDFLFIDDAVDAFVRASVRGSGLVVNIGTGVQTQIRDLADACRARTDPAPTHRAHRDDDVARFAVSAVRARIHLAWEPWTPLADGIAATLIAR
jgi:UDP-glucose 4-epimerase